MAGNLAKGRQDVWTVKEALDWTVGYLTDKGDGHPRRSAEWLLSAACGLSRVELYAYFDRPLTEPERDALREGITRRATGEPLQYVTGEVAFRHIIVRTERGVLIPRPETETLVDVGLIAVDEAIENRGRAMVADLCTGSGVVGLSIAHEREGAEVYATDIDGGAIALARRNAEALRLSDRVEFFECDLADAIPEELSGTFDLVISNPPYIPTDELASLDAEIIGFEPRLALDGGPDGLDVFRRLVETARTLLRPGGMFAVELHEKRVILASENESLVKWYQAIEVHRDLTGRNRILSARCR